MNNQCIVFIKYNLTILQEKKTRNFSSYKGYFQAVHTYLYRDITDIDSLKIDTIAYINV